MSVPRLSLKQNQSSRRVSDSRNAVRSNLLPKREHCHSRILLFADCGNLLLSSSTALPMSSCNMPCSGNSGENCGGSNALLVFYSGVDPGPPQGGPTALPSYGQWNSLGCYTDNVATRTLLNQVGVNGAMTPQLCLDACHSASPPYQLAGVEYAGVSLTFISFDPHPLIFYRIAML